MENKFISSTQIEKLGHNLLEIRERALFNIVSKLDNGFIFDNDLARSKELLNKLFNWFLFEPCSNEDLVFKLIKRVLKSESGKTLISHYGNNLIINELQKIRTYIEPKFINHVDDLIHITKIEMNNVPPLISDIPLSYRSSENVSGRLKSVESTATLQEGFIEKDASLDQQHGVQSSSLNNAETYRITSNKSNTEDECDYILEWQPLIEPDRHVLKSVEESLSNPPQPGVLLHSCEFFVSVLLHDFPAEVFIQRPNIVFNFFNLLEVCLSTRVINGVLNCLYNLTKALQVRLSQFYDPLLKNFKLQISTSLVTPNDTYRSSGTNRSSGTSRSSKSNSSSSDKYELYEDTVLLRKMQISVVKYCYMTANKVLKYLCVKPENLDSDRCKPMNHISLNLAVSLIEEVLKLLSSIPNILEKSIGHKKDLNQLLFIYGETLDYFRLESSSSENNLNCRALYLYIVHNSVYLLKKCVGPLKSGYLLPPSFKHALSSSLLDVCLARLYPKIHEALLEYAESFNCEEEVDHLKKYKLVQKVCDGMISTVKIIKNYKLLSVKDFMDLSEEALPSLDIHENIEFVKIFVDIASEKLPLFSIEDDIMQKAEGVTLNLLSHKVIDIREEMYRLCHSKVISTVGPNSRSTSTDNLGSQIYFLLTPRIFTEVAMFGITSERSKIRSYAENILNHIIKCKILVSEMIWSKTVEALIPTLPIISCHGDKDSLLGRIIINIIDPDTANDLLIPTITVLKSNVTLLFSKDAIAREEAFSRISWLLASQRDAREMLPRLNKLYDKALSQICQQPKIVNLNKNRITQHFYQPSSLYQIMEVLKSANIEPVIRRSALTQVSVMLEDPLLHQVFLDLEGVDIVVAIMKSALVEQDFGDYPDSIIPAISVLKHLSLYHSNVRENLSTDLDVIICLIRGMFLFFTEERVKQDGTILLFLLLFKDYIIGSPSNANMSLPCFVYDSIHVPFICGTHWRCSPYTNETISDSILKDKWCLNSLQMQWNIEVFGFQNLLKMESISYDTCDLYVPDELKMNEYHFESLKRSSIDYCIEKYLSDVQNGTSHSFVTESINNLSLYINLFNVNKEITKSTNKEDILFHPWEKTFARFLKVLPSSEDDVHLLKSVIQFLMVLVPCYKNAVGECWIIHFFKDPTNCILDLLSFDNTTEEESKILSDELLKLISICVCQEQYYLDYYSCLSTQKCRGPTSWRHVVNILADNLKFKDAQHFYNLAFLDSILSCFVRLTATLGWSDSKPNSAPNSPIPQMLRVLCELVIAFHCGKGPSAAVSVMGLSITRHVLLILNHVLAEIQNSKVKGWEICFLDNIDDQNLFQNFIALWSSRDVVLRAAALQLFNGLVISPRIALEVIRNVTVDGSNIWELAFSVSIDNSEANIVRENALLLLANLSSHTVLIANDKITLYSNLSPSVTKKDTISQILTLIEQYDFFSQVDILLKELFTLQMSEKNYADVVYSSNRESWSSSRSSSSSRSDASETITKSTVTTPSVVKNLAIFLTNALIFAPVEISAKLHEQGILKMLLKTLCIPAISIRNTKELSLYCDLLEMNAYVSSCLSRAASCSPACLGTILYTKDCFNIIVSILNPKIYHTNLTQLIYLRNRLWSEIFNLLSTLIELGAELEGKVHSKSVESLEIFSDTLADIGPDPFLETLCEALCSIGSNDLQNSALICLTSLLRVESIRIPRDKRDAFSSSSVQDLLDNVKSPRTFLTTEDDEDEENRVPRETKNVFDSNPLKNHNKFIMNLLEETYFGNKSKGNIIHKKIPTLDNDKDTLMAGGEVCKILLHLYDIEDIQSKKDLHASKRKAIVLSALSSILCISQEAKRYATTKGLLCNIIRKLREFVIKLSLDSVECLRRVSDKKRVCPVLQELNEIIGLLTNFMYKNDEIKYEAAKYDVADVIHKLWVWFSAQNNYLLDVLKMLCTFTTNCSLACQSLPLTNSVAGSGPKKSSTNNTLLHAIILLIEKEMNQVSKTHDLTALDLCFDILHNCCSSLECRVLLSKGNLLQSISRLHPALTKRQKPWSSIELIWLNFLQTFTQYPEGQTCIAKITDVLEIVMTLTNSPKAENRNLAMGVLRNLAFYQPNRPRLLASGEFLNILQTKMENGDREEKNSVVVIMWTLAANSQKAKLVLKSAHLDKKLLDAIKQYKLIGDLDTGEEEVQRMYYVLNILKEGEKTR